MPETHNSYYQLNDLRVLPGNRLEALRGERRGQHAVRINDQWRICFVWRDGTARRDRRLPLKEISDMTVRREDLDRGAMQFADIATGGRLAPVHPGEILREEFLAPMSLSVYALAGALKVSRARLNDLVRGRRAVTTDTALRLGRYFGTTPDFWINLQVRYELDASDALRTRIEREVAPRPAA